MMKPVGPNSSKPSSELIDKLAVTKITLANPPMGACIVESQANANLVVGKEVEFVCENLSDARPVAANIWRSFFGNRKSIIFEMHRTRLLGPAGLPSEVFEKRLHFAQRLLVSHAELATRN